MKSSHIAFLFAMLLSFVGCDSRVAPETSGHNSTPPPSPEQPTLRKLQDFNQSLVGGSKSDDEIIAGLTRLGNELTDAQLPLVEQLAVTGEGKDMAFAWARLLIDRDRMDSAATVIVTALARRPENRQYQMWKWWERSFGERPDFEKLNVKIFEAFMAQFEKGDAVQKTVIAEIFGKTATDAKATPEDFRKLILNKKQP